MAKVFEERLWKCTNYNEYDSLLNEVYKYLKQNMSEKEFNKLNEDELIWIKGKEELSENGKMNSTEIRCEFLISLMEDMKFKNKIRFSDNAIYYFAGNLLIGAYDNGKFFSAAENLDFDTTKVFMAKNYNVYSSSEKVDTVESVKMRNSVRFCVDETQKYKLPFRTEEVFLYSDTYNFGCLFVPSKDNISIEEFNKKIVFATNSDKNILPRKVEVVENNDNIMKTLIGIFNKYNISKEKIDVGKILKADINNDGISEFIVSANTEGAYEAPNGTTGYSVVLVVYNNGTYEVVQEELNYNTADPTGVVYYELLGVCDLDDDGIYEIYKNTGMWECASTEAFKKNNGKWVEVLRGDEGM